MFKRSDLIERHDRTLNCMLGGNIYVIKMYLY